jgi:nitrogen-specific signal transduction histidine kinase
VGFALARASLETQHRQAQKMETVGRLTAGIAHDFNNLLTVINGFAGLMQLTLDENDSQQERVSSILNAGNRGANLIRQLLTFSRKEVVKPEVLDLNATLSKMDAELRHLIGESITVETSLAADLWSIKVDAAQIEQVIVNLVVNARDAMPEGGHLTVKTANVVVDSSTTNRPLGLRIGNYVVLTVCDTGHGMSAEIQSQIFEPFFSTKSTGHGTGLGLAIVYGIVKRIGGSIVVDSKPGEGTTFHIYFPRERARTKAPIHAVLRSEGQDLSGSETILLADSNAEVRSLVRAVLNAQGYRVLEAEGVREAVRLATQCERPIDLLLADVVMPESRSLDLARDISEKLAIPRILLMSGYGDKIARRSYPILQKPFSPLELARKVRAVLNDSPL